MFFLYLITVKTGSLYLIDDSVAFLHQTSYTYWKPDTIL